MVIRDHGYWAFYLTSCLLFFKSYNKPTINILVFFLCSVTLATLFRAEGLILLALFPLIALNIWHSGHEGKK